MLRKRTVITAYVDGIEWAKRTFTGVNGMPKSVNRDTEAWVEFMQKINAETNEDTGVKSEITFESTSTWWED